MTLHSEDIARLCRELSGLLHAGIGTAEGLYLLTEEEAGPLRQLLNAMEEGMEEGLPLSDAMEKTSAFPAVVPGMVRIGEQTGRLEETLEHLALYYEQRSRSARQIKQALAYPSAILVLMLLVIGVLLIKVLPVFEEVYASLGTGLTGVSGLLLQFGRLLEAALPGLFALLFLLTAGGMTVFLHLPFREKVTAWYRRRFGDRGIARKFNNARFARGLAMGLGSGLALEEALSLSASLLQDIPHAADRSRRCADTLASGASIPEAMKEAAFLPPAQSRMLAVGLRGGNSDQVMEQIADQLLEDAENTLQTTVSRIEPILVMVTSALVGLILLSVMLPLLNILSAIG